MFGTCTPYNASLQNNGAQNVPGGLYLAPPPSGSGLTPAGATTNTMSSKGYGSYLAVRYVLYKSTVNPAVVPGPAPVYWTDETFTTVTGSFSEGMVANNSVSAAGWLLPNSGSNSGMGAGTTNFTATILNNGALGSWVFIAVGGWVPYCYINSGSTAGQSLYGSGNFAATGVNDGTAPTHKVIGYSSSAPVATIGNVWIPNVIW